MKLTWLIVLTFATMAQSQEIKFYRVQLQQDDSLGSTIRFFCSKGYDWDECLRDVAALRTALTPYPLKTLGSWSYYLVLPPDWKALARSHGGSGVSPAFSLLLGRATVLDRSLFFGTADRIRELEIWSGIPYGPQLLAVALSHELGHALCQEKNERLANEYGRELRDGNTLNCRESMAGK